MLEGGTTSQWMGKEYIRGGRGALNELNNKVGQLLQGLGDPDRLWSRMGLLISMKDAMCPRGPSSDWQGHFEETADTGEYYNSIE